MVVFALGSRRMPEDHLQSRVCLGIGFLRTRSFLILGAGISLFFFSKEMTMMIPTREMLQLLPNNNNCEDHHRKQICIQYHEIWKRAKETKKGMVQWNIISADTTANKSENVVLLRSLYQHEVQELVHHLNTCSDWTRVKVVVRVEEQDANLAGWTSQIKHSNLHEDVVLVLSHLGATTTTIDTAANTSGSNENGNHIPSTIISHSQLNGVIQYSTFQNCVIHLSSMISYSTLQNTVIGEHCQIHHCTATATTTTTSNTTHEPPLHEQVAMEISVGAEATGSGRKLYLQPEDTMIQVGQQLRRSSTRPVIHAVSTERLTNIVEESCRISHSRISGIYMHRDTRIQDHCTVSQAILLPDAQIVQGCVVENCILQWNTKITQSNVQNTMIMEASSVGPQSIVHASVLGPDTHVSAGEIHASILGPNTNAHHQSLLIGVLWPLGRGNVGYGANVGSNHTGRLPDQECLAGEGTFWGLSTVVKFPVALAAPYCILAAGSQLSPQRITMPFSLLIDGTIVPGWVLSKSPYTLARSATKFAQRRKAKRHSFYTGWEILRPDTIDACRFARQELAGVAIQKDVYTGRDISGLGNNTMTEKARVTAIQAYTDCCQRYVLLKFLSHMVAMDLDLNAAVNELARVSDMGFAKIRDFSVVEWESFPWEDLSNEKEVTNWALRVLLEEFASSYQGGITEVNIRTWLEHLLVLEEKYAITVYDCKHRDDTRGVSILPGYEASHLCAEDDPVIRQVQNEAQDVRKQVESLLENKVKSKL